jgi:hypothetical protein
MTNAGSEWTPARRIKQAQNRYDRETAKYEQQVTLGYVEARLRGPDIWEATLAVGPWSRTRATLAIKAYNGATGNRYRWTRRDQRRARAQQEARDRTPLPSETLLRYM